MSDISLSDSQDGGNPLVVTQSASSPPLSARVVGSSQPFRERLGTSLSLIGRRRAWFLLIIPYLAAWWIPATWGKSYWFDSGSAMSFQPLVPLGTILLVWCRRVEFWQIWTELRLLYAEENSRRRGHMGWLIIGCVLLVLAHIAHLPTAAITGLVLIAIGALRQMLGSTMVRALAVPLVFLLLVIPPPETAIASLSHVIGRASAYAVVGILNILGKNVTTTQGDFPIFHFGDAVVPMTIAQSGGVVLMASVVLALWLALMVRANFVGTFMLVVSGFIFSLSLSGLRLLVMVMLAPKYPGAAELLGGVNPYVLVSISFLLTFLVGRAVRFGQRQK